MSDGEKGAWPDEKLLEAVREGDEEALTILVSVRVPYLLRLLEALCRSRGVPDGVATAIAYQTMNRAAEQVRKGSMPAKPEQPGWFQKLAYQEFVRWTTDNSRILPLPPGGPAPAVALPPGEAKRRDTLTRLVRRRFWDLPSDHHEIVSLVLVKGLTVEAAGESMGLNPPAALGMFAAAIELLKHWINVHDHFDIAGGGLEGDPTTPPRPPKRPRPRRRGGGIGGADA